MKPPIMFVRSTGPKGWVHDFRPLVKILNTGVLQLNRSALAKLAASPLEAPSIVIYYYEDMGQIGLRLARKGDPEGAAFVGRLSKDGMTAGFRAKIVFQHHGIDIRKAGGIYPLGWDDRNALNIFTLAKGAAPVVVDTSVIRGRFADAKAAVANGREG